MTSVLQVITHVGYEGPASIGEWARGRGLILREMLAGVQDFSAVDVNGFDGLVIMGGPMGVYEERRYPWMAQEKELIARAIDARKKVLGICLGAQMIASTLGARVYPHAHREIGWFPVSLREAAYEHPVFGAFPREHHVLHWHGDTFDLPAGAQLMASSEATAHQAFMYGEDVVGLQYHIEVREADLGAWFAAGSYSREDGEAFVQTPTQIMEAGEHFLSTHALNARFLTRFFAPLLKPAQDLPGDNGQVFRQQRTGEPVA